jgi:hypothetical protein
MEGELVGLVALPGAEGPCDRRGDPAAHRTLGHVLHQDEDWEHQRHRRQRVTAEPGHQPELD